MTGSPADKLRLQWLCFLVSARESQQPTQSLNDGFDFCEFIKM